MSPGASGSAYATGHESPRLLEVQADRVASGVDAGFRQRDPGPVVGIVGELHLDEVQAHELAIVDGIGREPREHCARESGRGSADGLAGTNELTRDHPVHLVVGICPYRRGHF